MSVSPRDLLFYAGGECLQRFGTLVWRPRLAHDLVPTFTRSGAVGPFIGSDGVLRSASANRPRIEFVDLDGDGTREPTVLVEASAGTNICLQSENFGTTWAATGTPTRSAAAHTSSGVDLDLLGDDDGAVIEFYSQTITFTGDGTKAISWFAKEGSGPSGAGSQVILRDTSAGANRLVATITWSDGVPSVVVSVGSEVIDAEHFVDGVYRFRCSAPSVVAANTNSLRVYPASSLSAANTGNIYIGGMQAENNVVPTSYAKTTTTSVSHAAETFDIPITFAPQALTGYIKLHDTGNARKNEPAFSGDIVSIGRQGSGNGFIQIDNPNTTSFRVVTVGAGASQGSRTGISSSDGDLLEIAFQVDSAFGVAAQYATDGGSPASLASVTNADGMPDAWAADYIRIHRERIASVKIAAGTHTMAAMRNVFPRAAS